MVDTLLALIGCRRGLGPPPTEGTPHSARDDWRWQCPHCWLYATLGAALFLTAVAMIVWAIFLA